MIFTKDDPSNNDEKVEKLTREFDIHYRACIDLFVIYKSEFEFCSTQVRKVLINPGKVHFEGLVNLLRNVRDNKALGLKYYADINDEPLYDLLRQASIKTDNQLMDFSDSSWQDFPDTGIST